MQGLFNTPTHILEDILSIEMESVTSSCKLYRMEPCVLLQFGLDTLRKYRP
jgi:hypothetical protein